MPSLEIKGRPEGSVSEKTTHTRCQTRIAVMSMSATQAPTSQRMTQDYDVTSVRLK